MSSKSAKKRAAPAVKSPARAAISAAQTAKSAAPADDAGERARKRQATLTPSEVACLGLRNGMTPEEVNARITQVYPED